MNYEIGTLVKFRGREWVIMPNIEYKDNDIINLRPLTGSENDSCIIYLPLEREKPAPTSFPRPSVDDIGGDFTSARLLRDSTRLLLRDGAAPFKCLGRISFRPRPYQFVPLLMALRLDPVKMLLADDVGVGKTIEAGLIARELYDRGEIFRFAVVCPPYLCDQWQKELSEKFNIDAKIIRTNTLSRLERELPSSNINIFEYYPFIITSIDFIKSEKRRASFIQHCPELVIIDEAHGCSRPGNNNGIQQQRYRLVSDLIKKDEKRNVLLVTATPHSGIEESFLSLLGFINPDFENFDLNNFEIEKRKLLAKHFIQRRRKDVEKWMGTNTSFPERISKDISYRLSEEYQQLFKEIYNFSRDSIISETTKENLRTKVRYWSALTLLRCVMSSPEAAKVSLNTRLSKLSDEEINQIKDDETDYSPFILDYSNTESALDIIPTNVVRKHEISLEQKQKKKLKDFLKQAENIISKEKDYKINTLINELISIFDEGYKPIIFCRFIATANYLKKELDKHFEDMIKNINIKAVTGELSEDEREIFIEELSNSKDRILIATDCLSEGINLQESFNAIIHYDLPWNPNRLEQREGRIDRFGQKSKKVKTILLYGENNPIDGSVLKVLLRKAKEIHKTLGITVPLPIDSESVMESVIKTLFNESDENKQLELFDNIDLLEDTKINEIHTNWEKAAKKESKSRTIFAQHSIKPEEVSKELESTDSVLGNPGIVEDFIKSSFKRLGATFTEKNNHIDVDHNTLDNIIKIRLGSTNIDKITFETPSPEGITYISRNHILTVALSEYILNEALSKDGDKLIASRISVISSKDVDLLTVLFLIRVRYIIDNKKTGIQRVAEECLVIGFKGILGSEEWFTEEESKKLFEIIKPSGNVADALKKRWVNTILNNEENINLIEKHIEKILNNRATQILTSHKNIRKSVKITTNLTIKVQKPFDIISTSIIIPD